MEDNKKIIIISGKARHGKTTVANIINHHNMSKTYISPLAKYIKLYLKEHGLWDGLTKNKSIRSILQFIGTDLIRVVDPDFHVRRTIEDIKYQSSTSTLLHDKFPQYIKNYRYFVVDDVRFKNELEAFDDAFPLMNVIHIHITRDNFDDGLTKEQKQHRSEIDLDGYDFTKLKNIETIEVLNSGNINDLEETICSILDL